MTDALSFRAFLHQLDCAGELARVEREVNLRFELAAVLWHNSRGPAVVFENVKGHSWGVAGNVLNSRARFGAALNCDWREVYERVLAALDNPVAPVLGAEAPCQEQVFQHVDLTSLPVPTWLEQETGPYVTAGVIVARDVVTRQANLSIARLKVLDERRAFIGIAPNHHLMQMARRAAERNEKLEVAVTIGNHPAVVLASNLYVRPGEDELGFAGALLGQPVPVARCRTVDLHVPADCELVLEGELDPAELVEEGPVSEFHGMYQLYKRGPIVTFKAITARQDPIFQVITPAYQPEHILIGAVGIAATCGRAVRTALPDSGNHVVITEGSAGRMHAVITLHNPVPGDARKAMFALWSHVNLVKMVTVTDDDIDPYDPVDVERAVATRFRAERDLTVVPGVRGDRADPMVQDGLVTKMGLDATMKAGDRPDWVTAQPPASVLAQVASGWPAL